MSMSKRRIHDIHSLKLAKAELKSDIALREAKIELEFNLLKDQYFNPTFNQLEERSDSWISTIIPSSLKPIIGNFLIKKVIKPKGKFSSAAARLIITYFLK